MAGETGSGIRCVCAAPTSLELPGSTKNYDALVTHKIVVFFSKRREFPTQWRGWHSKLELLRGDFRLRSDFALDPGHSASCLIVMFCFLCICAYARIASLGY